MPLPGPIATGVPTVTDIVLLGAGAAHLEVLRLSALRRPPGVRLSLVTPDAETPYPGRLSALLRGDCSPSEACIDLAKLAVAAGARLILAEPTGLDLDARTLELAGRPPLPFDLLSVDLSGESAMPDPPAACIPLRPSARFLAQLPALEAALPDDARLAIVGGDPGTAVVEQTLALARRFRGRVQLVLATEAAEPLAAAPTRTRRAVRAALVEAGVELVSGVRAGALADGRLALSDGSFLPADVALWAGGTRGPGFLAESGLACDAAGRVRVNAGQRSISHPCVFSAGDCAAPPHHAPSGRLLFANLRRAARGRRLTAGVRRWGPRPVAAGILDLGGGRAVAWCNGVAVFGPAVWRCRGWLDRWRMRRYAPPIGSALMAPARRPSLHTDAPGADPRSVHARSGVGAGAGIAPLGSLPLIRSPDALMGLGTPDHVAVLTPPVGQALVQSVSSLRACLDDPFVFGQIAAAHALSQHYATGAQPWTALAIAASPAGAMARADAEATLAGVSGTLFSDGCTLVAARHTEAADASVGLVVTGLGDPSRLVRKSALRPGDVLLLTKPLGTGIVLAAHERGMARGAWLRSAIDAMRTSNAEAARVLRAHGASACAGVAERGLLGHLADLLHATGMAAVLWPEQVPALPGALELAAAGVAAVVASRDGRALADAASDARTVLLGDPQVSGGLLCAVPPGRADACLAALHRAGLSAAVVGMVEAAEPGAGTIRFAPGQGRETGGWPSASAQGAAAVLARSHA